MFAYFSALPYFIGWRIIRLLPEKVAYALFYKIGDRLSSSDRKSIKRLRSNLARVKPDLSTSELDTLMRKSLRSYMRYWCDTFRSPGWSTDRIIHTTTVFNEHLIMNAISEGRAVVVALPHSGNWDHAGSYFCIKGAHLVTVAERLKPEAIFNKFLEYRQNIGMEVLALDSRSIVTLLKRAKEGALIALVSDRDLSASGVEVEFFGHTAKMPAGPALVAIKSDVELLTASVTYTESGIHIYLRRVEVPTEGSEAERIAETVQLIAKNFEAGIAAHPQDWHMLQKIWLDLP